MNAESFHTYRAFANTFHMPLITPNSWYSPREAGGGRGKVNIYNY